MTHTKCRTSDGVAEKMVVEEPEKVGKGSKRKGVGDGNSVSGGKQLSIGATVKHKTVELRSSQSSR